MNSELICLPLAFLFLANVGSIIGQKGAADAELRVRAGQPLRLECALGDAAAAQWRRDGAPVPADLRAAPERAAGPRLLAALAAPAARAAHAGLYTCSARADYRVRLTVLPAEAETEATPEAAGNIVWYDVRGNLTLRCDLPADKTLPYVWKKNGTDVSEVPLLKGRHALDAGGAELAVRGRSVEDDFGPYECAVGARAQAFDVRGRPHPRLPANSQVVEGQKLKLTCKLTGKPYVSVTWTYNSSVDAPAGDDVLASLAGRAQLQANEQGVEGAELVIAAAERTDAGLYWCHAGSARSSTRLHVKDMYAALWPFLGICAEVVVLCAVILLYERRRAKPELDDSDTDNHDQKKS